MADQGTTRPLHISVGIPTMNNEESIERMLRQLDEQTRPPDRVIVVDASTDATPEIVADVGDDVAFDVDLYEQSDRGRGVGAARADIYDRFEGDVLACLDTEHAVDADWLAIHEEFHRSHPAYGVLSNSGRPGFDGPVDDPLQSHFFGQSNCSLKREALDATGGWDPWMQRGEDWDLRIRLWTAGVKSWAKHGIAATPFGRDLASNTTTWFRKKVYHDPSSVTFLRKYGLWYLRFYPLHVAADLLSLVAVVSLAIAPLGLLISPVSLVFLLGLPLASAAAFTYYKGPRKRSALLPRRSELSSLPVFFALGLSVLRNLRRVGGDETWNYQGFDKSARR